jgi:hypothetical protein
MRVKMEEEANEFNEPFVLKVMNDCSHQDCVTNEACIGSYATWDDVLSALESLPARTPQAYGLATDPRHACKLTFFVTRKNMIWALDENGSALNKC